MRTISKKGIERLEKLTSLCNQILLKGERHVFYEVFPHVENLDISIHEGEWVWDKPPIEKISVDLSGKLFSEDKFNDAVKILETYAKEG